jgi:hypothetical protein
LGGYTTCRQGHWNSQSEEINAADKNIPADANLLDINTAKPSSSNVASHRGCLFREDHQRMAIRPERRFSAEKDSFVSHLRTDQVQNHRKAQMMRLERLSSVGFLFSIWISFQGCDPVYWVGVRANLEESISPEMH